MTNAQKSNQPGVDEAINQVLESEKQAQQAVVECQAAAEQKLTDAHLAAQRIARRTDKRITKIHLRFQQDIHLLEKQLKISDAMSAEQSRATISHEARVNQIVATLADKLTRSRSADQ